MHFEDRSLVRRLLKGDERAFVRFFDDNFPRLYRFAAARMSDDPEGTREAVQSTLTKAVHHLKSYRGESALFTWLCAICRNELADQARRGARQGQLVPLSEDQPEIRAALESLNFDGDSDPVARYQRHESCRLIQVALDQLPARYGNALEWKYIEGHSVKEIARRLELSTEAAQSLLARAKRAFREIYGTLAGGPATRMFEAHKTPS